MADSTTQETKPWKPRLNMTGTKRYTIDFKYDLWEDLVDASEGQPKAFVIKAIKNQIARSLLEQKGS
jgi:hypothetical protein